MIFKGAFFSGKTRKLIFENMYLYEPAIEPDAKRVRRDYEVKKEFFVICVTRLDNP